ncbi:MAG: helix-turn-helix domain-containing protein [Muribaculaceae bacterium]|nr:helix-turn-helix domain-containing protein [Muribaculaceae bacterium]
MRVGEIKDTTEGRRANRKRMGKALKEAREKRRLSVLEVERRTGVSRTIISRTEAGRANTTIDTINTLADCYGYRLELMKEVPYFNSEEAFAEFLKKQREQGKK